MRAATSRSVTSGRDRAPVLRCRGSGGADIPVCRTVRTDRNVCPTRFLGFAAPERMDTLELSFLAGRVQELNTADAFVDPLFEPALIEDLPGNALWRANQFAHLTRILATEE